MSVTARLAFGMMLLALSIQSIYAYLGTGDILLRVSILEVSETGEVRALCDWEEQVETRLISSWRINHAGFLPSLPGATGATQATCSPGADSPVQADAARDGVCGEPIHRVGLEAFARLESEDERSIILRLDVREEPEGCAPETPPASDGSAFKRELVFSEDAVASIPVRRAGAGENAGAMNLVVRLETLWSPASNRVQHSSVLVEADGAGGLLFLDGGSVGSVPDRGALQLQFVRPGLRVLRLETPGRADRYGFVRAEKGRTYRFSFRDDGSKDGPGAIRGLEALGANTQGFQEFRRARDRASMVEIPEGEFLMGNQRTERSPHEHMVYLSTFLMDKVAVTWGRYLEFVADTGRPMPTHRPYWGIHEDHPAVYVTRQEALNYCTWAGARLPTEAEREKAARGTDGRMYPWGEEPPSPELAVFRRQWGKEATDPVGIRPLGASPYGVLDMGGNVWEWCYDWYSDEYLEASPYRDPSGPANGTRHVLRGGSWDSRPDVTSASCRNWGHPGYREGDYGFRCAMSAAPK